MLIVSPTSTYSSMINGLTVAQGGNSSSDMLFDGGRLHGWHYARQFSWTSAGGFTFDQSLGPGRFPKALCP